MTYKVLALKWRPGNFDQIIGQEHITKSLKNAIKFDRISHAFTFSGPRGVGKTTTARILAKELNSIDDINSSFDIIEMDAASNRGIDEIRSLRENVSIAPAHGRYKIYIIDEVHMLTKEAFNALLKTLEEPPDHVVFILATTDPYKMPSTILSRTQRYDFRRLSVDDIKKQLVIILNSENKEFNEKSLTLIARKADGSMRDALGYLDQVMNYCGDEIDFDEVQNVLGIIGDSLYLDLFNSICNKDIQNVSNIMDGAINTRGASTTDFISDFNAFLRKILHCMIGKNEQEAAIQNWVKNNQNINQLDVIRIMEFLMKLEVKIKFIDHPDLALELLMIKLCKLDNVIEISDFINQLNSNSPSISNNEIFTEPIKKQKKDIKNDVMLDNSIESEKNNLEKNREESHIKTESMMGADDEKNNTEKSKEEDNIKNDSATNDENDKIIHEIDLDIVNKKIPDIINFIDEKNSKTAGFMGDIEVMEIDEDNIKIRVNNISKFLYDTLLKDIPLIKDAFNRCLNTTHHIVIIKGKELPIQNKENKKIKTEEEHPLLMNALEKFDGKIIK